jgi:hypothetical protein
MIGLEELKIKFRATIKALAPSADEMKVLS